MARSVVFLLSLGLLGGGWLGGGLLGGASHAHAQYAPPPCGPMAPCAAGYVCQPTGLCAPIAPGYGVQPVAPGYGVQQPYAPVAPHGQPQVVERANIALIVTGAVMLGVSWITNIVTGLFAGYELFGSATSSAWDSFRTLSILPVVGPWAQLAAKPTRFDQDDWGTWLIIDGLLQAAGLTMLIVGIVTPSRQTIYASRGGVELAVVPYAAPGAGGLSLLGTF